MRNRDLYLDLLRAILAALVVFEHIRHCIFQTFSEQKLSQLQWHDFMFYGLTSLGHQAVIGFFCLSGYFIATTLEASVSLDQPFVVSALNYLVRRISRIYTLFFPLLMLSLPLFYLSNYYNPGLESTLTDYGFGGAFSGKESDLSAVLPTLLLCPGFFGKQVWQGFPISWSLVNEVWYYITSAGIVFLFWETKRRRFSFFSLFLLVLFAIVLLCAQSILGVLGYFPFFLIAFFVSWFKSRILNIFRFRSFIFYARRLTLLLILITPLFFLFAEQFFPTWQDYLVALWVVSMLILSPGGELPLCNKNLIPLNLLSKTMSDHSYSLYLSHSLLVIGFFGAFSFDRLPVGKNAYLLFCLFIVISYLLAWIVFRVIDSRHRFVAKILLSHALKRP